MKISLTLDLVKRLRVDRKPVGFDEKGGIVFQDNPSRTPYIVNDASDSAPPGYGVKVAAKKTYILRRKIHGKSVQPTVGNAADFPDLATARARAARLALQVVDSGGANPNAEARKVAASEITLGQVFANYREYLTKRKSRPAGAIHHEERNDVPSSRLSNRLVSIPKACVTMRNT